MKTIELFITEALTGFGTRVCPKGTPRNDGDLMVRVTLKPGMDKRLKDHQWLIERDYPLRAYRFPMQYAASFVQVYHPKYSPAGVTFVVRRNGILLYLEPPASTASAQTTEATVTAQTLHWKLNI